MKFSIPETRKLFKKIFEWVLSNFHLLLAIFITIYTVIPILSPILLHFGFTRPGWWIQTTFRIFCHQRPERSIFLFGEKLTYSLSELINNGYWSSIFGYPFVGSERIGYKVAFCIRCTFLYGTLAATGLVTSLSRKIIKISWWTPVLLILPMTLDGTMQFLSEATFIAQDKLELELAKPYYLSNNLTRAVTGGLFGLGIGLFIFSQLKIIGNEKNND
ncbi:MAG: DUF2085 domain-containing protein [Patescibacteria group bacterium]|nr:DUF2085 domain-containing protein [Patescibacteria group bacterium]